MRHLVETPPPRHMRPRGAAGPRCNLSVTRRTLLVGAGASAFGRARASSLGDDFAGAALAEDVSTYASFGVHQTGSVGDIHTADWLADRLSALHLVVSQPKFSFTGFKADRCELVTGGRRLEAYPAWPVHPTPWGGITGRLQTSEALWGPGALAVVTLPYRPGGAWAAKDVGDRVLDAFAKGVRAVVAVTEGPTGEVIQLNAQPAPFRWPGPVVLCPGRASPFLQEAGGAAADLYCTGAVDPTAQARNVVARRPGEGRTLVVSTPMSGWFCCASERGGGVAILLALAAWLARSTSRPLAFLATSGHELSNVGGAQLLASGVLSPEDVDFWLHLGANVAVRPKALGDEGGAAASASGRRTLRITERLLPIAQSAFAGQPGYGEPVDIAVKPGGEAEAYRSAGFTNIAALVGASPLFHTPLDLAGRGPSPEMLEAVGRGCGNLFRGVQSSQGEPGR